jgi:CRISPR-associated protein Cas1
MRIPSSPISLKERNSMLFLRYGMLDVQDGAFVLVDEKGVRVHIPVGGVVCLFLEPGTTITHAAVSLAADVGTLLVWVGERGVRLYAAGQPGGARSDKLLYQAKLALDDDLRIKVVRAMYKFRFQDEAPNRRSIEQLRGIEGARVKAIYSLLAKQYGVKWAGRKYDPDCWDDADPINKSLSAANHALYGICEAAILAAGYAPAIGFIHSGKPLSFVYDIADLFKFETVIPVAFKIIAAFPNTSDPSREVRTRCRDMFRESKILARIIPTIEDILAAGEIHLPLVAPESVRVAIPVNKGIGDAGHRH